ncbi:MAG: DNA gyrase inhibitor YacG [Phycisphaerae bacterium]
MPRFECPECEKVVEVATNTDLPTRPFCSDRCKMIDLGKWLDGSYMTSHPAGPDDFDEEGLDPEAH